MWRIKMDLQVPNFHQAQVLVFGDVMLDRYWQGPTSRISPEAPVPVVKVQDIENRAGGAGNVALNIATLGAKAHLFGITGDDENANDLEYMLKNKGVDCGFLRHETSPTITKLRILSRNQQLIRLDFEESFNDVDLTTLYQQFDQQVANAGAVILSDYNKGALTDPQRLIQAARQAGTPVLVDPKGTDFSPYKGATLITPNLAEFEAVVGYCKDDETLFAKGKALL
jgi:D-beta-D-heptose 7-phosphate kinase/D-beta-D-heptose 1-phosphate adenosyltransferase